MKIKSKQTHNGLCCLNYQIHIKIENNGSFPTAVSARNHANPAASHCKLLCWLCCILLLLPSAAFGCCCSSCSGSRDASIQVSTHSPSMTSKCKCPFLLCRSQGSGKNARRSSTVTCLLMHTKAVSVAMQQQQCPSLMQKLHFEFSFINERRKHINFTLKHTTH